MDQPCLSASERWRAIVQARAAQMDAAYARLGRTSADFWDRRARRFHAATRATARADPFFRRVRRAARPTDTVLDVGAGTGRFALALAPAVARVIAVEPNQSMRAFLAAEAEQQGVTNLEVVPTRWEDAPPLQADLVICSHVLYPIAEIGPFLARLDAAAGRRAFVYHRALQVDALTDPLWRHFHGEPRRLPPDHIEVLAVLRELGILADATIVWTPSTWRYESLDQAVEEFLEMLVLPDEPSVRTELLARLGRFLVRRADHLGLPVSRLPSAVISWGPRQRLAPRPSATG